MKKIASFTIAIILSLSVTVHFAFCESQKGINVNQLMINYYSHLRTLYALNREVFDYKNNTNAMSMCSENMYMIDGIFIDFDENSIVTHVTWSETIDPHYSVMQFWSLYASFDNDAMLDNVVHSWTFFDPVSTIMGLKQGETLTVGDYEIMTDTVNGLKFVNFSLK